MIVQAIAFYIFASVAVGAGVKAKGFVKKTGRKRGATRKRA